MTEPAHQPVHQPVHTPVPRKRRAVLLLVPALAVGVIATGIGLTVSEVNNADRTAATRAWADRKPGAEAKPRKEARKPEGKLAQRLLPVPKGYVLGPDIRDYGNDAELGKREAVAMLEAGARDLPRAAREQRMKAIDTMRLGGFAMRSYAAEDSGLVIETQLMQMKPGVARDRARTFAMAMEAFGGFDSGPRVKGHKDAKCHLSPKETGHASGQGIRTMVCLASADDLLVITTSYGSEPLDTKAAAKVLREQLDLVVSPGEYV